MDSRFPRSPTVRLSSDYFFLDPSRSTFEKFLKTFSKLFYLLRTCLIPPQYHPKPAPSLTPRRLRLCRVMCASGTRPSPTELASENTLVRVQSSAPSPEDPFWGPFSCLSRGEVRVLYTMFPLKGAADLVTRFWNGFTGYPHAENSSLPHSPVHCMGTLCVRKCISPAEPGRSTGGAFCFGGGTGLGHLDNRPSSHLSTVLCVLGQFLIHPHQFGHVSEPKIQRVPEAVPLQNWSVIFLTVFRNSNSLV